MNSAACSCVSPSRNASPGISAMASSKGSATSLPITEAACSSRLCSAERRSMREARIVCTVGGTWMVPAGCADEVGGLDQRAHALLEEQRIALGALDEKPLERRDAGLVADQRAQKLLGACGRQRIDAQLPVTGLAAPAVAIFRPVVHRQHHGGGRHRVDEIVEEGLRLGVDPVQVLEHEE